MEFRILGPLEVEGAEGKIPARRKEAARPCSRCCFCTPGEVVSAGRLIELLWDEPPADASKALQVNVSRLRKALGSEDVLQTRPGGYLLQVEPDSFDMPRFERSCGRRP